MQDDPIIVFGAPRSGTTYLQRMLSSHPRVAVTNEVRVFAWAHHALNDLVDDRRMLQRYREPFRHLLAAQLPDTIRALYREIAPEAEYWGDKNPHYGDARHLGCLDTVLALFPAARFLHVIRDGRAVVASLMRSHHMSGKPWADFERAMQIWAAHVDIGRQFGARVPGGQYLEARYEDVVADDLEWGRRIFAFLGIDFHPQVEEFVGRQRVERTPLSSPTRDLAAGASQTEWDVVLTREQQEAVRGVLGDRLAELGY